MTDGQTPARARRPLAVAFDVNETLTDLAPLREVFAGLGLDPGVLRWWFAALLRDGLALAAAGDTASFGDLAVAALAEVASASGRDLPDQAGAEMTQAFSRVPCHPDVAPALARLRAAGIPALALTNGNESTARRILGGARVADDFAAILSVDAVGHWKPRPEPYHYAAQVAGVPAEKIAMVAVHPWDLHGAAAAGLVTGWVNRDGRGYPSVFRPPAVEAANLDAVVAGLLGLATE